MPSVQEMFDQHLFGTGAAPDTGPITGTVPNPFLPDVPAAPAAPAPAAPTKQNTVAAVADQKKAGLAQTADAKKADVAAQTGVPSLDQLYSATLARNSGTGNQTLPSQELADLNNMTPYDLAKKYGFGRAQDMINAQSQAQGATQADINATRTPLQRAGDFTSGVGLGVVNSVGGVGALAAGAINQRAGVGFAGAISSFNKVVQDNLQSDGMNAHRQLNAAQNELGYRDNEAQYQDTKNTDGTFVAGLRKLGQDATTAVGNAISDPTVASDGVAQGIGSLLTAGPIGKGIAAGANVVGGTLLKRALVEGALAADAGATGASAMLGRAATSPLGSKVLDFAAHEGPTMAGIGATEAGGAYQQNASDVADKSFDDLAKSSPMFNQLVEDGMRKMGPNPTPDQITALQEEARTTVANRSGLIAAAIQGPVATATGALVSKFEAHPLKIPTLRELGQNILKEGGEETIQSGTGQLAQNIATQKTSNPNQDLLEGVGEQAGLGGLYGAASAGLVSGPGSIMSAGTRGALGISNKVSDLAGKRGDRIMAENEAKSPVSDQAVSTAAAEATQNTPAAAQAATDAINSHPDLNESQKEAAHSYVEAAKGVVHFDPAEVTGMPDVVQRAAAGQTSRIQFLQNLANEAKDPKNSAQDQAIALGTLTSSINNLTGEKGLHIQGEDYKALEEDHPAKQFTSQVADLVTAFQQSPAGKTAVNPDRAEKVATKVSKDNLTAEQFDTPEGQKSVQANIAAATISPQNSNRANNELILAMATAGKVQLDNHQSAALRTANAILDGQKAYQAQLAKTGLKSNSDLVSQQVTVNQGSPEGGESALEHMQAVRNAYGRGDMEGAKTALLNFQKFVQSQQNKIGAVNAQITAQGGKANPQNSLHYDAARRDKTGFTKSVKPFGVDVVGKNAAKSIGFVQQVAAETQALTGIHNALATAFPELGVKHLGEVSLDPSLSDAHPSKVAKEFADGTRGKPQEKAAAPEVVKESEAPAAQSSNEAPKNEAPKQPVTSEKPETKNEVKESVKPAEKTSSPVNETASLEQEREDLINRKIDAPLTKQEDARLAEIEKALNPGASEEQTYAAPKKYKVVGETQTQGVAAAFPSLVQFPNGNKFTESFKFPKAPVTKLAGEENPLKAVTKSLSSEQAFSEATGKSTKAFDADVRRSYRKLLTYVPHIIDDINAEIAKFLAKGKNQEHLDKGTAEINRYRNGKLMNLVEENEDGKLVMNRQLAETAALAGLQWLLGSRNKSSHYDNGDIASIFGIDPDLVDANGNMENFLKSGALRIEGFDDLAQKIQSYWGVVPDSNADIAYTKGITQAVAAQIMKTLSRTPLADGGKLLEPDVMKVDKTTGQILPQDAKVTKNVQSVEVLKTPKLDVFEHIAKMPDAIERVVAVKPELTHHLDGDMPQNSDEQMRNPGVKLTTEQNQMVANESDVPHRLDMESVDLFNKLNDGNWLVKIFGPGEVEKDKLNKNDLQSKEGQVLSITAAFQALKDTVAAVTARALDSDRKPEDIDIRYGYGVSKVGRLQMLGAFNPQASKLVRHAILPTQSVLNMLDGNHIRAFDLGVAQGLGVKVHNMSYAASKSKMLDLVNGKYAPALEVLRGYLKSGKLDAEDMEKLHASLGSNASVATFYALKEYARLLNTREAGEDTTKFKTKLYLEADGMTNGPVMAMAMFARGATDATWLQNMSRGGLYFGGLPFQNSTVQRQIDPVDLYKATSNNLNGRIAANLTNPDAAPEMKGQMRHVLHLMNILLGDNVIKFDGGDQVEMERDIAKNPLTVTMYASGANGIANKIVGMLTDAMYKQMSTAMQNGWDKAEIFGPEQQAKNAQFLESLKALRSFTPEYDPAKKQVTLQRTSNKPISQELKDFTFGSGDLLAMQKNIRKFFVNDMRKSITEVVGDSTFQSMDMVKTATQVQSIVLQHLFERGVEKALAERAKSDPTYQDGDFLSQRALDGVRNSLSPLAPLIKAPGQTFYMSGRNQVGLAGDHFAASLNDDFRVPATVYGPGNIGVAGVASLNIGMGDGRMIQTFSNDPKTDPRRLLIFDGIHLALDQINEGSQQANNAVWQTWMGNPLKAVSNAFDTFMQNLPATEVTEGSDLHKDLVKALFGPKAAEGKNLNEYPPELVVYELQTVQQQLARAQMEVEARHAAMDQVNVSVDQMAAAASPYQVTGKEMVVGTPEQVAQRMSEITQAKYDELRARDKKNPAKVEAIPTDLAKFGQEQPGGARVIGVQSVNNLIREVLRKIPRDQAVVLQSIQKTLAADGYSIVHGTREQLLAYNATLGADMIDASHLTDGNTHGFTLTGRQQIWMVSPSSETLTHELIHASTFYTVLNFYSGNDLGKTPVQTREAIQNLEVLMQQFTGLQDQEGGLDAMPRDMQVAYNNAATAIDQALNNPDLSEAERKAAALNEYMAWGLANQNLALLQKRVDAHWLVQMARNVVSLIRQMVFGQDKPMAPQGDMFSNLLFNTQVVMASQPSLNQVMQDTVLYQNSQYGSNDRLTELDDAFDRTVTNWIAAPLAHGNVQESLGRQWQGQVVAQDLGHDMAQRFSTVFPEMTLQEKTTFGKMVAGLTTEASFDPNTLSRMSQLWNLVNKHLTADMMEDPTELDDNQRRTDAQKKVDAIRGTTFAEMDSAGRSTLLPTFVALSQTNDQFRAAIQKIATEKQERSTAESRVDRALENLATDAFDSLGRRISGEGKSKDVLAAMDALSNRLMDIAQERQTARSLYELSGEYVDSGNDYVVQGMNALARAAVNKAEALDAKFDNKLTKTAAAATRLFAAIVNEEEAGRVAESALTLVNRIEGFKPFTDIIHDMIGRVASNAQVYDMIKTVRSMVQKMRQQFREEVPKIIAKQFSRELTEGEWDLLHKGMGRSDLASLVQGMSQDEALSMIKDTKARDAKIKELEDQIKSLDKSNYAFRQQKMQELAHYMMTGETASNLLRNAAAIARMAGTPKWLTGNVDPALTKAIDQLTSLYALNKLGEAEQSKLSTLTAQEEKGMKFALSYLQGQREEEMTKAQSNDRALLNHFKGYIPQVQQAGSSLIVADDAEYAKLAAQSYVRLGDYKGSNAEAGKTKKGYYYLPVSGRQAYQQGILQNVRQTAGGVDITSGYSQMLSAGRITDVNAVKRADSVIGAGMEKGEHLLPVFDESGEVAAYERSLDPAIVNSKLEFNTQLHQMLGVWRGRQVEEQLAAQYNNQLIDKLADMHTTDINESAGNQSRYVDVFDKRELAKDPVLADAVKLITPQMRQQIEQKFGKQFFVRRDMLNDALGYRSASIGDAWTGNSRWSDATQKQVQRMAMGVFGNKAYQYLVNAEKTYQNLVSDAKTMIVVKSVVVPISNLVANAYQLVARGVPLKSIIGGMPKKTAEVKAYVASEVRRIAADAELRAAEGRGDVKAQARLNTEIRLIQDGHKRLSIWPLIQAGEFSAVSDGKATAEEVELTSGRLQAYIERKVNQLPPGIRTAGRYAMVTKDTALFQGMQAATEYGDFLAKAILYDDLTRRQGKSKAEALARVTEEFVNYDRLPGRFRGYAESMGLMWFYNFKIRSAKVALSMIRNNPVHALLAGLAPTPPFLGSVGLPTGDNLFTQLASGGLVHSIGPGQLAHAPMMMPLAHILGQ